MFLPGRPFQPSLMFASKARAYQEKTWCHDTHNNDIQNDIKGLIVTLSITGHYHYTDCCVSLCSVLCSIYCYTECHCAECAHDECCYAECHFAECANVSVIMLNVIAPQTL